MMVVKVVVVVVNELRVVAEFAVPSVSQPWPIRSAFVLECGNS